jgi:putative ABC transport system permease protein
MSMMKLAYQNFKNSFKNYLSLIISLAFTILIFFNFQNIIDSHILDDLGGTVLKNVEIIIQVITIVLVFFMIFFIWYSTNVFLAKRKKEIGIYIFMGLTNHKIGELYMIETTLIGCVALFIGMTAGMLTTQLFQMILFKLSDITIDLQMGFSIQSVFIVSLIYLIIYFIFVLKGYIQIVRSSVLDMISATKQNEYIKQNNFILIVKTLLGIIILCTGYYLAIKKAGMETMNNALLAVILVIIGVYLLFGGFIPFICQSLAKRKIFLYHKERNLWINNVIFRIKKNYRSYAMVCILMLCSVTALATGFAMKNRHDNIVHFRNTYTFQVISTKAGLYDDFSKRIEKENTIAYGAEISFLQIDPSYIKSQYLNSSYGILSYSQVEKLAKKTRLEFDFKKPQDNEYINVDKKTLLTIITDISDQTIEIHNQEYKISDYTTEPYLGYLQEKSAFYMVNDEVYNTLKSLGQENYLYNYKIVDPYHFDASIKDIQDHPDCHGLIKMSPKSDELQWVRILYSLCIFMFLVFILASGSIIFMKIYNDAFEEKERYQILQKIGISKKTLKLSIAKELSFCYLAPLTIMAISSYFSIHALGNMMQTDLLLINIVSVGAIIIFFLLCYIVSVSIYQKNVNIKS